MKGGEKDTLSARKAVEIGKAVAGEAGEAVFINGMKYVLTNDSLVEQAE